MLWVVCRRYWRSDIRRVCPSFFIFFVLATVDSCNNLNFMRRQAGFIKTYNRASSPVFQQEPSEFSYFKVRPGADEEEFSPYKF